MYKYRIYATEKKIEMLLTMMRMMRMMMMTCIVMQVLVFWVE